MSKSGNLSRELQGRTPEHALAATVANVRSSCAVLANKTDCPARIDKARAAAVAASLDPEDVRQSSHHMETRCRFTNLDDEVTFHLVLHLFNFGHGYRHQLHEACGVGAWQTMKRGVEAMQDSASNGVIDAAFLATLSTEAASDFFGLPEAPASPLSPLRDMIVRVANVSGQQLQSLGYSTFAEFLDDHSSSGGEVSGPKLVQALADCFPPFDDRRILSDGSEVLFLKKAQIAVAEIYQRFGDICPERFQFTGMREFTVVCDNVLPCVLRSLGILQLAKGLKERIDARISLPAGEDEAHLRASAVTAAELILEQVHGAFWAKELGDYLWTLGKDHGFRKVERHATTDTCFY